MPNFNRVILMGNLTRDPELRYTPNGQAVADLGLAVNRRTRTQEGERREDVTFVDVTAWGRQAEIISEYLGKGQPIFLEGRLQLDQWTSQDGQRRSKLRVVLERFQFLGSRSDRRRPAGRPEGAARPQERRAGPTDEGARPPKEDEASPESFDDDVPF